MGALSGAHHRGGTETVRVSDATIDLALPAAAHGYRASISW
jgi:hypothetical protein